MHVAPRRSPQRRYALTRVYRPRHRRRSVATLAAAALVAAGGTGVALTAASSSAIAAAGTVAGIVFEDYNANGVLDAGSNAPGGATAFDRGVADAVVTVTDSTGATVGSVATGASGTYSVTVGGAATTDVRVQITPPTGYTTGPHGPGSGTTVQFVTLGSAAAGQVDLGVVRQGNYASDSPAVLTVQQIGNIGSDGTLTDPAAKASIVNSAYSDRGTTTTTTEALMSQTGSVWGLAQVGAKYAFTGALFKRHVAVGPGGLGQIYLTDLSGAPNATAWARIPNAGTDPRGDTSGYTVSDWFHDVDGFTDVAKVGLGGVAIAPDYTAIYTVNLNNRSLYKVPFTGGVSSAPVAGTPQQISLPLGLPGAAAGCANASVRPFGVSSQNGAVWVTLTCTGPDVSDLRGYVYRYDSAAGTFGSAPAFEMALGGYARGFAFRPCCSADWHAWPNPDTTWPIAGSGSNVSAAYPEPLLSDVTFDANGDMTIGIKDRFGDQVSYLAGNLTPGDGSTYQGFAAGDDLRACVSSPTTWALEANGTCGTGTGSGAGDGQGPGGGEFYSDDYGNSHFQTSLGGLLQLPGYGQVVSTAFDPAPPAGGNFRAQGYKFLNNGSGASDDSHQLLARVNSDGTGPQGNFGKAGGLGDLTALVAEAPIEIGNRVWLDSDADGVQDPGETPIAGVTVRLYAADGTTVLATAVTDANGNYYFSNATTGTSSSSAIYAIAGLTPDTDYVVKLDNPADYTGTGPLAPYAPTRAGAGSDTGVDSNGTLVGGFDQASVHTGVAGTNDHTIDFGFTPPTYAVGDYVWYDDNRDGIQDVGERPVRDVTVTLLDGAGNPATRADGTPVPPVQTDTAGHYVFDYLPAGDYQVQFATLPTGYAPTTQSASGSTAANDSNPDPATLRTPTFPVGASAPNMRPVQDGDGTTFATAINPSIDMGIVAGPSVFVGDFVWLDINRDGQQTPGEPGIEGVTVTLTGPDGNPVTDIFGDPVGPATTDANGLYGFPNLPVLPAGQHYTTHVDNTQPALSPYLPTLPGVGSDESLDSSTGSAESGDLTADGDSDTTLDFGFVTPSVTVGNFVWVDTNRDGIQDAGEPGIPGVTVTLTGPDGGPVTDVFGNPVEPVTTNASGQYDFFSLPTLPAGQHYTTHIDNTQAALARYVPTTAGAGTDPANDSSTGSAQSGDLTTDGAADLTLDFGFVLQRVMVGDFVFVDTNRDGVQDVGDPGIANVTLTLTGPDGGPVTDVFGNPVGPQTTDADGLYLFSDLPALPAGQHYTTHVDNTQAALAAYAPTTAGAGTDRAADSSTSSAESGDLTTDGAADLTLDYGFITPAVSVGDFVWIDTNRDGVQDAGEPGIAGVTLALIGPGGGTVTDVFGNPVGSTITDVDGHYDFADLPALPAGEHYTVRIDDQPALAAYLPTRAGAGGDPSADSSTGSAESGDLTTNGASDSTLDFGFVTPAVSVGNVVWLDADGDGVQGAGEPGIAAVTVTLTGPDGGPVTDVYGAAVGPVLTGANGAYLFQNLPVLAAGQHYTTHIDNSQAALAPYKPTRTGQGTRATDSATSSATSAGDLTVDGASDLTLDFGFVPKNFTGTRNNSGPTGPGGTGGTGGNRGNGPLSVTGEQIMAYTSYGLALLLVGVFVLLLARRRRSTR